MPPVKIRLPSGHLLLVDAEDAAFVRQWVWYATPQHRSVYAVRPRDRKGTIRLHRELALRWGWDLDGRQVDHVDGNGLNNTRANLRVVSQSQNSLNQRHLRTDKTSRFLRVRFRSNKKRNPWGVQVRNEVGRNIHGGSFDCEVEAALNADLLMRHFHGNQTSLNFESIVRHLPSATELTAEGYTCALAAALEFSRQIK